MEIPREHAEKALEHAKKGNFDELDRFARIHSMELAEVDGIGPAMVDGLKVHTSAEVANLHDYNKREKNIMKALDIISEYKIELDEDEAKKMLDIWIKKGEKI